MEGIVSERLTISMDGRVREVYAKTATIAGGEIYESSLTSVTVTHVPLVVSSEESGNSPVSEISQTSLGEISQTSLGEISQTSLAISVE